nr:hypothetical protein [Afipia sp. P52-10]
MIGDAVDSADRRTARPADSGQSHGYLTLRLQIGVHSRSRGNGPGCDASKGEPRWRNHARQAARHLPEEAAQCALAGRKDVEDLRGLRCEHLHRAGTHGKHGTDVLRLPSKVDQFITGQTDRFAHSICSLPER